MAERYRHVKTGGTYTVIARGKFEFDTTPCVIYRSEKDGTVWVRSAYEFDDGRFEPLPAVSRPDVASLAARLDLVERLNHAADRAHEINNWSGPAAWCPHAEDLLREAASHLSQVPEGHPFQGRVLDWLVKCFGVEIARDSMERNHRFLEEALELVQACGCTASEAHQLVDYTFNRPIGEKVQEVGGALVTLSALCSAQDIDMAAAGETELARIWTMVEKIRAKQAAKPKHSPLPAAPSLVKELGE